MTTVGEYARFVATADIRHAVAGREVDVLDALGIALGIDWRAGRPHINCPYPSHDDGDPSWRWDAGRARAYCTFIEGSDSALDVLMKCKGVDFETAKIRAAELIGRTDLIRENSPRYQAASAASLLSAPADRRDDNLPVTYLAHRLGVTAHARADSEHPDGGPEGTGLLRSTGVGIEGQTQAGRRIPVRRVQDGRRRRPDACAPNLCRAGRRRQSRPRRPRRPAARSKEVGEDHPPSGRAVLWGDTQRAPWIVLCEGIETGAAVAFALRSEAETGETAVASAISASGVEAFQLYPRTARVTVAADRDEAPKPNGKPGSRRGERAARRFALRQHESLSVEIALPGEGESVDWLDVLERDGVAAVRDGILAATPFSPTLAEPDDISRRQSRDTELQEIKSYLSPWQYRTVGGWFIGTRAGQDQSS